MKESMPFLDDLARMAGGAASLAFTARQQIAGEIRLRVDDLAQRLDYVPREDHERLREMTEKLRLEQEEMKARLAALEKNGPAKAAHKAKGKK
jgi:BMFP domain-containing protein YqiC